jgi:protein-S-isoprenylcysteine O-methyltransferase Ste14
MHWLELRVPPLAILLAAGLLMWLADRALLSLRISVPGAVWLSAVLALLGVLVSAAGVIEFRRARTTVNPMTPTASSSLVVGGIYKRTRNPMYLGFALILFAWAIYLTNVATWLALPIFVWYMNRFQIFPEERALERRFGRDFAAYRGKVRRWL